MNTIPLLNETIESAGAKKNGVMNTACYRGYVGSWQIKDGTLYLTDIDMKCYEPLSFDKIFKEVTEDGVAATWVSAKLQCTTGKILYQDYYKTIFEYDATFDVKDGKLISYEEKKNEPPAKK